MEKQRPDHMLPTGDGKEFGFSLIISGCWLRDYRTVIAEAGQPTRRCARDLLRGTPVRGDGEGARIGFESFQTAMQV